VEKNKGWTVLRFIFIDGLEAIEQLLKIFRNLTKGFGHSFSLISTDGISKRKHKKYPSRRRDIFSSFELTKAW
jgi:hypothetical protein